MFTGPSSLSLVGALVSAGAYAQPLTAAAQAPVPVQAVENILRARVDIYCGHHRQAMAEIRAARQQLSSPGSTMAAEALAALEEAAWLTRRHQHVLAEQALAAVWAQIAPRTGQS